MGSQGNHVLRLQARLQDLGYDPGPLDGAYGYLTYAAVRDFQRDYRLQADGVAGRRVRAVLSDESLLNNRSWTVIAELKADSGTTMAVRTLTRQADVVSAISVPVSINVDDDCDAGIDDGPGAGLDVGPDAGPDAGPNAGPDTSPYAGYDAGSGVSPSTGASRNTDARSKAGAAGDRRDTAVRGRVSIDPDAAVKVADRTAAQIREAIGERVQYWSTLHDRRGTVPGDYARGALQEVLHSRRGGSRLETFIKAPVAESEADVIHLELGDLRWGDGARFLSIVKRAARHAAAHGKQLVVSLPLKDLNDAWTRLANDIDYAAIGGLASRVVLVPPARIKGTDPPRPPSARELAARIHAVVRRVPPWRCLLAIPMGALLLPVAPREAPASMSYQRAMALAYVARTRPQWDDAVARPMFRGRFEDNDVVVWPETKASFAHKVDIVRRTRLAGVYLSSVGDEDIRLWRVLRDHLPRPQSPAS